MTQNFNRIKKLLSGSTSMPLGTGGASTGPLMGNHGHDHGHNHHHHADGSCCHHEHDHKEDGSCCDHDHSHDKK